jgi:hypothetical protein
MSAYQQALQSIAQPLLHAVGPAVIKAVRQVEQGLSKDVVVSSSSMAQVVKAAEQSAARLADQAMEKFGRLVLQVILEGE